MGSPPAICFYSGNGYKPSSFEGILFFVGSKRPGNKMRLSSDMTGHRGTPMKETGGLSQPPRSLNRSNKTKQNKTQNIVLVLGHGENRWVFHVTRYGVNRQVFRR